MATGRQALNTYVTELAGVPQDANRARSELTSHFKEKRSYEVPIPKPDRATPNFNNCVALQSEMTEMEELYWFAMALTGDPEFAAKLVADTKKLPSTGRGVFHN